MTSSLPHVHHHPLDGSSVLPILKARLPQSIALYRRLQLPHRSPSSYILATFGTDATNGSLPNCFCIAFMDRSRRSEVEAWVFLSGQDDSTRRCPRSTSEQCIDCTVALLAMIKHMGELPVPESVHTEEFTESSGTASRPLNDYDRHKLDHNCMLLGSLGQFTTDILHAHKLVRTDLPHAPFQKFILRTGPLSTVDTTLPPDLRWGEVRPQDFALVKSRTEIPRKDKTLALCPSMAIFPTAAGPDSTSTGSTAPIAWAFIGMDGALATLHTEPEYRGRGLAKKVTAKLLIEKLRSLDESEGAQEGGWLGHSDVSLTNKESQGVAKSLGGTEGWLNYWIRVDMGMAMELVSA